MNKNRLSALSTFRTSRFSSPVTQCDCEKNCMKKDKSKQIHCGFFWLVFKFKTPDRQQQAIENFTQEHFSQNFHHLIWGRISVCPSRKTKLGWVSLVRVQCLASRPQRPYGILHSSSALWVSLVALYNTDTHTTASKSYNTHHGIKVL